MQHCSLSVVAFFLCHEKEEKKEKKKAIQGKPFLLLLIWSIVSNNFVGLLKTYCFVMSDCNCHWSRLIIGLVD